LFFFSFRQAYGEAFELMKKQRINLNLFYDHDPQHFLAHCDKFVVQISSKDVSNLNLFLGELQYDMQSLQITVSSHNLFNSLMQK